MNEKEKEEGTILTALFIGLLIEIMLVAGVTYVVYQTGLGTWLSIVIGVLVAVLLTQLIGKALTRDD